MKDLSMDTHKLKRGARLGSWIDAHGGATACLIGAGYEQGSKEFKARESFISQARKSGMGHVAALRFEAEFEQVGMQPGDLTNNLDAETASGRSSKMAAAVAVLHAITLYELRELTDALTPAAGRIMVLAPDDLPPHIPRGGHVTIDLSDREPLDDGVLLVKKAGGAFVLGVCRVAVGGFEIDAGRGQVLDEKRHGLVPVGTATDVHISLR